MRLMHVSELKPGLVKSKKNPSNYSLEDFTLSVVSHGFLS